MSTLRTVLSMTAEHDFELENVDVDTACLKVPVEELFAKLPSEFSPSPDGIHFVRHLQRSLSVLNKTAVTGTKSSTIFYTASDSESNNNPCLYLSSHEGEETDLVVTVRINDRIFADRL